MTKLQKLKFADQIAIAGLKPTDFYVKDPFPPFGPVRFTVRGTDTYFEVFVSEKFTGSTWGYYMSFAATPTRYEIGRSTSPLGFEGMTKQFASWLKAQALPALSEATIQDPFADEAEVLPYAARVDETFAYGHFTETEKLTWTSVIDDLTQKLAKQADANEEALKQITRRMDEIKEQLEKLNRWDFTSILIGAAGKLAVNYVTDPDRLAQWLGAVKQAVHDYWQPIQETVKNIIDSGR